MRRSPFALLLALAFALALPTVAQADVNLALRAWGGEASASSVHSSGAYPASAVNDNTRQARNGYWNDNTHGQYPDWVQVAWAEPRTVTKLVVRIPLAESHHSMDVRTLRNARLQIWRAGGSAWEDAGSPISNWTLPLAYDGSEIRSVDLPSPTAVEKVRFLVDEGSGEGWSWLEELEAWGPADRPNQALALMGGRATASSTYPGFPTAALNDGKRQDRALYWNDFDKGVWPDWAQIDWDRPRTIDTIVVRVPLTDPALPEGADTLGRVRIQAWDEGGQEWTDVDAPVTDWVLPVTRDGSEKKTFTFPEVRTDKVRVLVEQGNSEGWSLLEEIEAYGPWPNPNLALPGWGARVFANSQYPEYPMGAVQNGHRERRIGYWNDNTVWQWPDFVGVEWDAPQTIQEVILRLPVSFPEFNLAQRTIKRSRVQIMRPGSTAWEDVGDPILDWTMPLVADGSEVLRVPLAAPTQVSKVRYLVDEGNSQGWSMLDELEVYRSSPPALPTNVTPPTVAGAAGLGATLTCDPGAWSGATELRYRWERDGQLLSRNQTYTLTQADGDGAIRCVVTAMNEAGMTSRATNPTVFLPRPPAPSAPAPPSAAPDADGVVSLSWSAVSGATEYIVERAPAGTTTFGEVGRTAGTSLILPDQAEGVWVYRVRSVVGGVHSRPSDPSADLRVDLTPPVLELTCPSGVLAVGSTASASIDARDEQSGLVDVPPTGIALDTATAGDRTATYTVTDNAGHSTTDTCSYSVRPAAPTAPVLAVGDSSPDADGRFGLTWGTAAGATEYVLERAVATGGIPVWGEIARTTGTSITFATPEPEGTYVYRVKAVAGGLESLPSPSSAEVVVDLTPPTLTLSCPGSVIGVGDTAGAAITAGDNLSGLTAVPPPSVALDTTTAGSRTATYTVTDRSGHSTTATCDYDVRPPAPSAPVLAAPDVSPDADGLYSITWGAVAGTSEYVVERMAAGGTTWTEIARPTTNTLTFSTTAEPEGRWHYRVRAVAGGIESLSSAPSSEVMVDKTAPSLTLTCPTGVVGIGDTAYATIAAGDALSGFAGTVPGSILVDTATGGVRTASYTVTDRAGHSTTRSCTYDVRPPAPTRPVLAAPHVSPDGDGEFAITWGTVSSATAYVVERTTDAGATWTEVGRPTANSLTFPAPGQPEGRLNYRVRALAGAIDGVTSLPSDDILVDRTAPTLTLTCPATAVGVGDGAVATISANDNLAGFADAIPGSIPLDTSSPGVRTASYTVTDRAGHSTTRSCTYDVRPPAPSAPVLASPHTSPDADGRYTITWSTVAGATRYVVERAPAGGSTWTELGQPTTNSLTFSTTPQAEGTWNYRVRAVAGTVEGMTSASSADIVVDVTPPSLAITCPTGVIGVGDTVSATIAASDNLSGFASPPPASFVVTTATPGPKTATYTVTDRAGHSTTATCTYDVRPAAPTRPVVAAPDTNFDPDGRFTLQWGTVDGATQYIVERAPAGSSTWTEIGRPSLNTLTWSATPHAEGTWNYRVRAVAGGVEGATSLPSADVVVDLTPPSLSLSCPTGVIGVGDTVSAGITASDALSGLAGTVPASFVVSTASPGPRTATYTVTDRAGHSTTATCTYDVRPAAPTRPVVAAPDTNYDPDGRFTLQWGTVSGATRYIVERAPGGSSTWTEIAQPTTNSLVFNTTPEPEGTWRYRVRAVAGGVEGATSPSSDDVFVDLTDPSLTLTCPTGLLAHNAPANASVTASDSGSGLASTPVGALPLDTSVPGDRTATYTVTDRAGRSTTRTCTYTVRPPAPGTPQVAAPDTYFDRDGRFTLTWTAASGASAYIVERSPASGSTWTELGRPTTNSLTFNTPAQPEGEWIYRVTSIAGSAQSAPSASSATVTVDMTAPTVSLTCPTGLVYVGDTASATLIASDSLSGLTAAPPAGVALVTTSAGDRTATYTATDRAGNATTQTCAYSVRYRGPNAPVVTAGANPGTGAITLGWTHPSGTPATNAYVLEARDANDTGWTQVATPTTNSWTVPAGSPLAQGTWTFRVRATTASYDPAWSPSSANVVVDRTAPNAPSLTADRAPDLDNTGTADDWYRGTVTLSFAGNGDPVLADGSPGSGVDPASIPANRVFNTTGTHTATGTVRDRAGNTTASVSQTVRVDADVPTTTLTCPTGTILQDAPASASWTAADVGSGLVGASSGTMTLDTSQVGTRTATVPVTRDRAGNVAATRTCTYRVIYDWTGFLDPVDNGGVYNDVNAGDRVPIPFQLNGNRGLSVLAGPPTFTPVSCGVAGSSRDDLEFTAPSWVPAGLSYQSTYNAYVWVWETNNTHRNNCYDIAFTLNDGTPAHVARFRVK